VEITWYGEGCVRLRSREGVVAADAYRSVVGPTGRGLTADVITYSHPDAQLSLPGRGARKAPAATKKRTGPSSGVAVPSSLEPAFELSRPGEFEVHDILITGVRTFRDESKGAERGENVCFVYEMDGIHVAHMGDIGHLLDEQMIGEIGTVEVVCVPVGGALPASRVAELVAQLDANLVVPLVFDDTEAGRGALDRFMHEMGVQDQTAQPRLQVTISSVPNETTLALLEARGRS
jgi:L-ascorbate metabolism protein UlaG (beta-lactamase superfamily)